LESAEARQQTFSESLAVKHYRRSVKSRRQTGVYFCASARCYSLKPLVGYEKWISLLCQCSVMCGNW